MTTEVNSNFTFTNNDSKIFNQENFRKNFQTLLNELLDKQDNNVSILREYMKDNNINLIRVKLCIIC